MGGDEGAAAAGVSAAAAPDDSTDSLPGVGDSEAWRGGWVGRAGGGGAEGGAATGGLLQPSWRPAGQQGARISPAATQPCSSGGTGRKRGRAGSAAADVGGLVPGAAARREVSGVVSPAAGGHGSQHSSARPRSSTSAATPRRTGARRGCGAAGSGGASAAAVEPEPLPSRPGSREAGGVDAGPTGEEGQAVIASGAASARGVRLRPCLPRAQL